MVIQLLVLVRGKTEMAFELVRKFGQNKALSKTLLPALITTVHLYG